MKMVMSPKQNRSLPSRERGLKWVMVMYTCASLEVAPFTGAWIEITSVLRSGLVCEVAPFTGAWIEMTCPATCRRHARVAPFTGAWIEMARRSTAIRIRASLPSRERGLK